MLTENQNKLIEDLRKEFSKMNIPTKVVGGGLINKADIDSRLNESVKRRAELQCITNATHKAVLELMDIDMERLNYDLIPMGMIAQRNISNDFFVRIDVIDKQNRDLHIPFQYRISHAYESLPDRSGFTYYTGFHSIEWASQRYKSIDELCKNKYFSSNIEDMYKSIIKNKNN